nr:hypothetical protein [Streptomyces sabulosicollis]
MAAVLQQGETGHTHEDGGGLVLVGWLGAGQGDEVAAEDGTAHQPQDQHHVDDARWRSAYCSKRSV